MGDEVVFHCDVSGAIPPSLLSLERVLDTLEATQEVPRHPLLLSRGTKRVPPQLKKSPSSPSSSQEEGPFPCFFGEGIPKFPSHLKRRRSPLDAREELQGSCHHFKRPLMTQFTPDTPDSPALTRRSPGGALQNTMAVVTALFPLKGKPPITMVNQTGKLTLLFQVKRRAVLHGTI